MTVRILGTNQKARIVADYEKFHYPMHVFAKSYGCSPGTIRRILQEAKVLPPSIKRAPKTPPVNETETKKIMGLLYRMGIGYDLLESILNAPALSANNVAIFLKQSNPAQLAIILQAAGLTRTLPSIDTATQPIPKDAQQPLFPPE